MQKICCLQFIWKMECNDKNCPEHGELATRGITLEGAVVSDKMQGTVTVFSQYTVKVAKFERFKRKHSKIKAHNPPCIAAKSGDRVRIAECRPLSKDVHFVVISKETPSETKKEKQQPKEVKKAADTKATKPKKTKKTSKQP
ncbi:MAG: 30S ribosomal protein S17 [Candidatus Altiarchaeota archaeon]|nr:30S ribosomal protein S17 [Candidatus Altiarchaeota archaeon]